MSGRSWVHGSALVAAAALAVGIALPAAAAAGRSPRSSSSPERTDLVFLRPLLSVTAPRSALAVADAQSSVAATARSIGARVLARTRVPDALVVRATSAEARSLATLPQVAHVLPNTLIPGPTVPSALRAAGATPGTPAHAPCGTAASQSSTPRRSASSMHVGPHRLGLRRGRGHRRDPRRRHQPRRTGPPRNPAFALTARRRDAVDHLVRRLLRRGDERTTDGEEAFGDASSIAAQGNDGLRPLEVRRPRPPPPHGLRHPHRGRRARRVHPRRARHLRLRQQSYASEAIQGGQLRRRPRGQGCSTSPSASRTSPSTSVDALRGGRTTAAVAAGVTVVVSSGDAGIDEHDLLPGVDPTSSPSARPRRPGVRAADLGGINALRCTAGFIDNNISALSSGRRGPGPARPSTSCARATSTGRCARRRTRTAGCEHPSVSSSVGPRSPPRSPRARRPT